MAAIIPEPGFYVDWKDWAREVKKALEREDEPVAIKEAELTTMSAKRNPAMVLYVIDGANPGPRISDGTTWRRFTLI